MKTDIDCAIDILFTAKKHLSPGAIVISTLKLPEKGWQKNAYRAIGILGAKFILAGARQLFHNRSEVCVVLRNA
jgi:23S rRNA (cytidine2498-2'-O)-methyltransferase